MAAVDNAVMSLSLFPLSGLVGLFRASTIEGQPATGDTKDPATRQENFLVASSESANTPHGWRDNNQSDAACEDCK